MGEVARNARRQVVVGQQVSPDKVERSRVLRKSQTRAEHILWEAVRARRLNGLRFWRQQVIEGFIVDFYCHEAGFIVEIDGAVHEEQPDYDEDRDKILTARGLRILRLANGDVTTDLPAALARIVQFASPPPP